MPRKPFFREFDGWWYAQLRVNGKRKQIKLVRGRENQQEAYRAFCRLLADTEGEIPKSQSLTAAYVFDLFLDYSQRHNKPDTFELYRYYLNDFCGMHGRRMAIELKTIHITRWLDSHPKWRGSRRNAIVAIKRAFNWADKQGVLTPNPLRSLEKPPMRRRTRILTAEERAEIMAAIKDQNFRDFVFALQQTGCRPSEVARVTAENVNIELGVWIFEAHKTAETTGKPRVVYLAPEMVELTKLLMATRPQGPLFPSCRGGRPFTRNAIRCRFRRLRKQLPHLKHFVCYNLRHTFATDALANGVGAAQVAELLGHNSIRMIEQHYGHLSQKVTSMKDAAAKAVSGA